MGNVLPEPTPFTLQELPCFVSLHTPTHRLRGCIGCVATDEALHENIRRLALAAAHDDPRFSPVTPEEIPGLTIEISILGPLQPVTEWSALIIGKHGLKVKHGPHQGLLLAQVASEYGWAIEEFREETCIKAKLSPKDWLQYQFFFFEQLEFQE